MQKEPMDRTEKHVTTSVKIEDSFAQREDMFERLANLSRSRPKKIMVVCYALVFGFYFLLELVGGKSPRMLWLSTTFYIYLSVWTTLFSIALVLISHRLFRPYRSESELAQKWGDVEVLAHARSLQIARAKLIANFVAIASFVFRLSAHWISASIFFLIIIVLFQGIAR